ncbi:MAG: FlgD immunoglobulin-like domain containing protein [Candidatus Krumholzibacteriia bacterium]
MHRHITFTALILAVSLAGAAAALPAASPPPAAQPDKDFVLDGSAVHDVGELWLNVTNWGLIGSQYSSSTTYSDAPSAMWPAGSGINHLWGAGLWVGGRRLGEVAVSTGQYETEILALPGPANTIYPLSWQAPGASRYPWPHPDDDDDGLEDEDPFNGRDDDLDGAIDEDDAGVADQMFRAEMVDDSDLAQSLYPDHRPLGLAVAQRSFQWSADEVDDFVGFEYTLTNQGDAPIEDVYVGMFSDFDIAFVDDPNGAADDLAGFSEATVEAYPGVPVHVQVAQMHDGGGLAGAGWIGWALLGHPTDPAGVSAPAQVAVRSFQRYSGQAPYDMGGDPVNDLQRYETLAADHLDGNSPAPADDRVLTSCGPFAALAPGASLSVAYAIVAGADESEMLRNAARAKLVYEGLAFDRDGDPANGAEFVVRWLGPEEIAVAVEDADRPDDLPLPTDVAITAAPNPFNPSVEAACYLPLAGQVTLSVLDARGRRVRILHDGPQDAGVARWTWDGRDARGARVASGVYLLRLETEQRVTQRAVTLVK